MIRRALLRWPAALLAGCSVLPERPFLPTRVHPLAPERPGPPAPRPVGEALLLRGVAAAPGLEGRGLRRLRPDGTLDIAVYEEWIAPPAGLVEQALRAWLIASRRFPAVAGPGTRARTPLILEAELVALEALPAAGIARAGLAALLLREGPALEARVLAQRVFHATAPLRPAAPEEAGAAQAAAMAAALGAVFAALEAWLAEALSTRPPSRGAA